MFSGKIPSCALSTCQWKCCHFKRPGYYIILQPGELALAQKAQRHVRHLKIVESFHGGHRAVCNATHRICCDGGWKPFDCRYYPLYPVIDEKGQLSQLTFDPYCPLDDMAIGKHRTVVAGVLAAQVKNRPELLEFFSHDELGDFAPPVAFPEISRLMAAPS